MAILEVAKLGQPVLRVKAAPVDPQEIKSDQFQSFLTDLIFSMSYHQGVGLAAPQVFQSQRVVAVAVPGEMLESGAGIPPSVFINPEIEPIGDETEEGWEGCLSLKDLRGLVPRYARIKLNALDPEGKPLERIFEGFVARVIQHEVDHLDGIVFVDRMADLSTLCFEPELARLDSIRELDGI